MPPKVIIELTVREFKHLSNFLDRHEDSIATDHDGYGMLRGTYMAVFDTEPEGMKL